MTSPSIFPLKTNGPLHTISSVYDQIGRRPYFAGLTSVKNGAAHRGRITYAHCSIPIGNRDDTSKKLFGQRHIAAVLRYCFAASGYELGVTTANGKGCALNC